MMRDPIGESLEMDPVPLEDIRYLVAKKTELTSRDTLEKDFNYVRHNLQSIIEKGMIAIGRIIDVAAESESARNIEAASAYIKTLAELNTALYDMTEKRVKADEKKESDSPSSQDPHYIQNNNNAFILTSEDLIKMMSEQGINNLLQR